MAHHSAAKKSLRQVEKRTALNTQRKSRVRTFLKNVRLAIESGKKEEANKRLQLAESEMTKAKNRGIYKKNTVSRTISRLSQKIKNIS